MKATEYRTIAAFTYKCDISNRTFTFDSEDKYQIHLKFDRKKCKYCYKNLDKFGNDNLHIKMKSNSISNTDELSKLLRNNR